MIGKKIGDLDEKFIRNLKLALRKGIEMVIWSSEVNPLGLPGLHKVWQAFGKIQSRRTRAMCLYEKNSGGLSESLCVGLPMLQLIFEDPENPGDHIVLFIEGKEYVIKILTELADAKLEHGFSWKSGGVTITERW